MPWLKYVVARWWFILADPERVAGQLLIYLEQHLVPRGSSEWLRQHARLECSPIICAGETSRKGSDNSIRRNDVRSGTIGANP